MQILFSGSILDRKVCIIQISNQQTNRWEGEGGGGWVHRMLHEGSACGCTSTYSGGFFVRLTYLLINWGFQETLGRPWVPIYCHVYAIGPKTKIPKFWNKYSQNRNIGVSVLISTFMRLWAIYIFPRPVCLFCWRKYEDHSWVYINRSQTHECGNWGRGCAIPRKGIIHKWDFRCIALKSDHRLVHRNTDRVRKSSGQFELFHIWTKGADGKLAFFLSNWLKLLCLYFWKMSGFEPKSRRVAAGPATKLAAQFYVWSEITSLKIDYH